MTKRVLYVDDDVDIRDIAELALELASGLEVRTSGSGTQALADAIDWVPDIILLDVMMPQMDGPETLRRLRADERTRSIPVVFITARTQSHEVEEYTAMGALGTIAKPFDPMMLADQISGFLE